jgi:CRISPR-associated protein Cas2
MKVYIVTYDESDDRVRTRIAKVLESYGDRVQYSVFEVVLRTEAQLTSLCAELKEVATEDTDIRLYRLCEDCRKASHTLNGERVAHLPAVIII